jgi:hypothetical protein
MGYECVVDGKKEFVNKLFASGWEFEDRASGI